MKASKINSAKAEAILYILANSGLDAVKAGSVIEYAAPEIGGGYTISEFTVTAGDLALADMARKGTVELAATDAAKMTARLRHRG